MHIYLWAGLKSHLPGQHDYPQFLADWSKLLTEHGAVVDGSLHAPSSADLEHTDVVVIYKGDAGFLTDAQSMAAVLFDVATRPEYLAKVKREFAGIKALFAEYQAGLEKVYTVPVVPDPK